jgi:hypothetical protein
MALAASPAKAQTTAAGPYYANPSWDQQLPASTRFIVLSNWASAAVLDRETGLVWEKSPSTSTFTWLNAQIHCNVLNVGNRKGWRLPTIQELASLVDGDPANTSSPRLPPGHPFTNVQSSFYWSATTSAPNTSNAWAVFFVNGNVLNVDKDNNTFFWCVRGGQGVDPQ